MTWILVLLLSGQPHQVFHESYTTEALCEAEGEELVAYVKEFSGKTFEYRCQPAGKPLVWR